METVSTPSGLLSDEIMERIWFYYLFYSFFSFIFGGLLFFICLKWNGVYLFVGYFISKYSAPLSAYKVSSHRIPQMGLYFEGYDRKPCFMPCVPWHWAVAGYTHPSPRSVIMSCRSQPGPISVFTANLRTFTGSARRDMDTRTDWEPRSEHRSIRLTAVLWKGKTDAWRPTKTPGTNLTYLDQLVIINRPAGWPQETLHWPVRVLAHL